MSFGLFHPVGVGDAEKHTWFAEDYPLHWHKEMLEHYQRVKPYLSGSFFALTPCTADPDSVLSYQFDRPDLGSGVLFGFFRPACKEDTFHVRPVLEHGRYLFENVETAECFELLCEENTAVTLQSSTKPQSVLLYYRKID